MNDIKYVKIFYLSVDFEANWMNARCFCKTYDMELATFENHFEWSNFVTQANVNRNLFDKWSHIG